MIITTAKHGRTKGDGQRLIAHLAKTENVEVTLAEMGNCIGDTLHEFVSVAAVYRDAAPQADNKTASFHHLTINPSVSHPRNTLIEIVHRARIELDPSGQRPYAIAIHRKPRAEAVAGAKAGGSGEHAHLLIGSAHENGKFLDDGWSKIRTERLALELAHDYGEAPVIGRHFKAALRHLSDSRPEVATWLEQKVVSDPVKPEAAFSPNARARARGEKLNLPKAKAAVRVTWSKSENAEAFSQDLFKIGFVLKPGNRAGVWIIEDGKGRLIGAANRLLKLKRDEFTKIMEPSSDAKFQRGRSVDRAGGRRSDQVDRRSAHHRREKSGISAGQDGTPRPETRRDPRSPRGHSLKQISRPHLAVLLEKVVAIQQRYERHLPGDETPPNPDDVYFDMWGIARSTAPPPKPR
jgi:hypothetical protein